MINDNNCQFFDILTKCSKEDTILVFDLKKIFMKNLLATCLVVLFGITACKEDNKTLTLSTNKVEFDAESSTQIVNVTSNTNWVISTGGGWYKVETSGDNGNGAITITVEANNTSSERTANILVTSLSAGITEEIIITQAKKTVIPDDDKVLILSTTKVEFSAADGTKTVDVISNVDWSVSVFNSSWYKVEVSREESNGTITITVVANTDSGERTADIFINSYSAGLFERIVITQAAGK